MDSTIVWDESAGDKTPRSRYFDDVYFNSDGAIAETIYVFIEGNQLLKRFIAHPRDTFVVAETGFGSGLNFLLLWQTFRHFKRHYPQHKLQKLQFYSVEKYPLSTQEMGEIYAQLHHWQVTHQPRLLQAARDQSTMLQSIMSPPTVIQPTLSQQAITPQSITPQPILSDYVDVDDDDELMLLANQLQQHWGAACYQFDNVEAKILVADVVDFPAFLAENLAQSGLGVDAWFFDGFSPQKNPAMWSAELFANCYHLTQPQGTFATFTAAGFVRRNLQHAGFCVNKRKGYGVKREMLVGIKA
ncbi:MnmC family methyltransferase [Orbaceae bacterium ESL0727]|nr:MnmC family methyltransferase [Orbaceae bacterium ESL0727]